MPPDDSDDAIHFEPVVSLKPERDRDFGYEPPDAVCVLCLRDTAQSNLWGSTLVRWERPPLPICTGCASRDDRGRHRYTGRVYEWSDRVLIATIDMLIRQLQRESEPDAERSEASWRRRNPTWGRYAWNRPGKRTLLRTA